MRDWGRSPLRIAPERSASFPARPAVQGAGRRAASVATRAIPARRRPACATEALGPADRCRCPAGPSRHAARRSWVRAPSAAWGTQIAALGLQEAEVHPAATMPIRPGAGPRGGGGAHADFEKGARRAARGAGQHAGGGDRFEALQVSEIVSTPRRQAAMNAPRSTIRGRWSKRASISSSRPVRLAEQRGTRRRGGAVRRAVIDLFDAVVAAHRQPVLARRAGPGRDEQRRSPGLRPPLLSAAPVSKRRRTGRRRRALVTSAAPGRRSAEIGRIAAEGSSPGPASASSARQPSTIQCRYHSSFAA